MNNFIQSPPVHYPNSHDSTLEVFRTRNFSLNEPYPPAYGAERAPPQYQEATEAEAGDQETLEARAKARKTRYIRIGTSLFIVTTVALLVAGVAGKISGMKGDKDHRWLGHEEEATESSSAGDKVAVEVTAEKATVSPTLTTMGLVSSTQVSLSTGERFTTETGILEQPVPVVGPSMDTDGEGRPVCGASFRESKVQLREVQPGDVSGYTPLDCPLAHPSFNGREDGLENRCSGSCGHFGMEGKLAEEPIIDEWEWDAG